MTYTNTSKTLVGLIATLLVATPLMSFAQTTQTERGDARFCESLASLESNILKTLDTRIASAKTKYDAHLATLTSKKTDAVAKLEVKREEVNAKWDAQIASMKANAETEADKAAIDAFAKTVESLNETRRASVNTAVTTFTQGVDGLRSESGSEYSAMVTSHKAAIEAAFNDAEVACGSSVAGATVRTELRADLNAAREAFKADRQEFSARGDFEELRKARVTATTAARDTFKKGFEAARTTLKTALGN